MSDTFHEILTQNDRVLKHLDRVRGYIYLATGETDPSRLAFLNQLIEREGDEMKAESDRFAALVKQFKEEKQMQRKPTMALMTVALILIALFPLLVSSVNAQDALATNTPVVQAVEATTEPTVAPVATNAPAATPAPTIVVTTPDNTQATFYIFAAVIFGLLAVIALVLRPLIVQLGASAPSWAVEAAFNAGQGVLKSAQDYASSTPSPIDDDLVAELRQQIQEMKDQIESLKTPAPQPPDSTPGGVG